MMELISTGHSRLFNRSRGIGLALGGLLVGRRVRTLQANRLLAVILHKPDGYTFRSPQ